jgi:hypothetical protein
MSERLVAALLALAKHNIPTDIQEFLVAGNPMRGIRPGALEAALPPKLVGIRDISKAERFYGEPVEKFRAMANATYPSETIDGAHFRMWCAIAADEIARLEAENRELRAKLETVRAALQLTAGALQAGQNSMAPRVAFTGDWAHLGTRSVSDILDTADAALAISSLKDKDQQNG